MTDILAIIKKAPDQKDKTINILGFFLTGKIWKDQTVRIDHLSILGGAFAYINLLKNENPEKQVIFSVVLSRVWINFELLIKVIVEFSALVISIV